MYDLIVIGSGPAGEKGAAQAAYFGKSVALIEREPVLGGACVNTGTIPSKTLRESALHLSGFRQRGFRDAVDLTIKGEVTINDFMYRKDVVVEREWRRIDENLRRHRVDRYSGTARFRSVNAVEVTNALGTEVLEGNVILIATGSSPYRPSHIPFDDEHVCDSDTILAMNRIPKSLAVVGAGVIGCEYASIFAALGIEVHLIDGRTALLPHIDREIVKVLLGELQNRLGVVLHLGADVDSIERSGDHIHLTLKDGTSFDTEKVLFAAGRNSNTADLDLPTAGVTTGNRGLVVVNESYQTNVPNIYAAGDVIGFPALASTSMEQARVAMVHAFDLKYKTAVAPILPYGIYTIPECSVAGETEESLQKANIPYVVGRARYEHNPRGQIIGDRDGFLKLLFREEDMRLLGVSVIGEQATELIHVGLTALLQESTADLFIQICFNYPTLSELYKYAAYDALGQRAKRK